MFRSGKYEKARVMYLRALERDARNGTAYVQLGLTDEKLGDHEAAIAAFRRALNLIPADRPVAQTVRIELADLYLHHSLNSETIHEAAHTAGDLLGRNPNDYDGRRIQALVMFKVAQWYRTRDTKAFESAMKDSLVDYQWANRVKPDQKDVMFSLARVLAVSGKFSDSGQTYAAILSHWHDCSPAYAELYRLLLVQEKMDEAQLLLKSAISQVANPDWFIRMLAAQATATANRVELEAALATLKKASKHPDAVFLLAGDFYIRVNDLSAGLREYRSCESINGPSRRLCQERIIEILLSEGRRAEAMQLNDAILKSDSRDSGARARRAAFQIDQGETDRALTELESVTLYDPKNYHVRYQIARVHLLRKETEQARQAALDTLELEANFLPAWLMLARIQFGNGEYKTASKSVNEILRLSPNHPAGNLMRDVLRDLNASREPGSGAGSEDRFLGAAARQIGLGDDVFAQQQLAQYERKTDADRRSDRVVEDAKTPSGNETSADKPGLSIYLKASACDEALARLKELRTKPEDPFLLAGQVPGISYDGEGVN
jgi:tetratricopeptide (TPR) repeat protein